ncbi:MAG: hypothetical protein HQL54_01530 [Magnetococcales bacterium]|nr:hypothetical protein [Magnetococcales bacterium]
MAKKVPAPKIPKKRNPLARVITQKPQQVIPNKKKQPKKKHRPDYSSDWAVCFLGV